MAQGKFITFEGGEGGGKSTQSKLLAQSFHHADIAAIQTREPGGTQGAEAIRHLLVTGAVGKWTPLTETLLHLAARTDHIYTLIRPTLAQGGHVICDRFSDSTMAYQGYGHQMGREVVGQLQQSAIGDFKPDLTLILDIASDTGITRAHSRGDSEDRYERMGQDFHQRVRQGFVETAKIEPQRCVLLDASQTIEAIHRQIITTVNEKLGLGLAACV